MEIALLSKEPLRKIAARLGTSPPALLRHQQQHMPPGELVSRGPAPNRNGDHARDHRHTLSHAHAEDAPTLATDDADLDDGDDEWGASETTVARGDRPKTTQRPPQRLSALPARPWTDMVPTVAEMAKLLDLAEPAPVGSDREPDGIYATVWDERPQNQNDNY